MRDEDGNDTDNEKYEEEIYGVLHCYDRVVLVAISNLSVMPKE